MSTADPASPPDASPMVRVDAVSKRFADTMAVDAVSIDIRPNEFFALLGPSGCGKTTLLRMLAGFEQPSDGRVLIDGEDMDRVPPNRRPVNMVFQSYAVFPHMSVADNVGYGLMVTSSPAAEIGPRVEEALAMVRLDGYGQRRPDQLSGGQRQRVALARALIKRPKVLLRDEPLSALDRKLREEMPLELVRLQHEVGITFVIVTHDQEDALSMAERLAVMNKGKLLQVAPPEELYHRPNCRMVADFIGKTNLLPGRVREVGDGLARIELEDLGLVALPAEGGVRDGDAVEVAIRPERIRLDHERPEAGRLAPDRPAFPGRIMQRAFFGNGSELHVELAGGRRLVCHRSDQAGAAAFATGDACFASFAAEDCLLLTG
jgi:spermidine/putrescine ABC transporter ATP-binding subunit